jgi:hypothetical protein
MRNIDHRLRRNRRILQNVLDTKRATRTEVSQLSNKGFAFPYCTHIYTNQKGEVYHFCYEYGYLELANGRVQIIRKAADMNGRRMEV